MARFENPDVSFDVPPHWEDRTIVAFAVPREPGQTDAANVVMNRDALAAGETIHGYADRQLSLLAKHLRGFELVKRVESTVGGAPAVELRVKWKGAQGVLAQRLLMIAKAPPPDGTDPVVLSFTSTAPEHQEAELDPLFDRIFASVKLGDGRRAR